MYRRRPETRAPFLQKSACCCLFGPYQGQPILATTLAYDDVRLVWACTRSPMVGVLPVHGSGHGASLAVTKMQRIWAFDWGVISGVLTQSGRFFGRFIYFFMDFGGSTIETMPPPLFFMWRIQKSRFRVDLKQWGGGVRGRPETRALFAKICLLLPIWPLSRATHPCYHPCSNML